MCKKRRVIHTLLTSLVLALVCLSLGCERTATTSTDAATTSPATQPGGSPHAGEGSAIATESPMISDLRRRAEGGDLSAMMTLGRAYQARGTEKDRAEARQWYEKADAAGGRAAKEAIATLDADARIAAAPPAPEPVGSPATQPSPLSSLPQFSEFGAPAPSAPSASAPAPALPPKGSANEPSLSAPSATTSPTAAPTTAPTTANADPRKVAWTEVVASYDSEKFATVDSPDYNKRGMFVGLSTAADQTMIVAATGPTGDDLRNVKVLIRVRSRQDPAEAQRVTQAAAIAATVTRNNVARREMIEWTKNYLASNQKAEPIFRNGWEINVSGPAAEGKDDAKAYLGNAVVVEFRK